MIRELCGGAMLALRRWPIVLALALMVAVGTGALVVALGDVRSQRQVLQGGHDLRSREAVAFSLRYPVGRTSSIDQATLRTLTRLIDDGQAYTALVNNAGVDDGTASAGPHRIVLAGDVVPRLYRGLSLCSPAPCAMAGADVPRMTTTTLGKHRVPVTGRLAPGATLFDPRVPGRELDDQVVIRAPASWLADLGEVEREEAMTGAVLLGPAPEVLAGVVSAAAARGLYLIPAELAGGELAEFRSVMEGSAIQVVGLVAFLCLVVVAVLAATGATLDDEARSVRIRSWSGARRQDVAARVAGFLATVLLVLPTVPLLALAVAGGPHRVVAVAVLVGLAALSLVLWAWGVRRVLDPQISGRSRP